MNGNMKIYRFRSIDSLLGEHRELDRQSIYFASPEELNDPIEGNFEVFWQGDSILWENLFKHFNFCFYTEYLTYLLITNRTTSAARPDIQVASNWNEPLTPELGAAFETAYEEINELIGLSEIASILGEQDRVVKFIELSLYLEFMRDTSLFAFEEAHRQYSGKTLFADYKALQSDAAPKAHLREMAEFFSSDVISDDMFIEETMRERKHLRDQLLSSDEILLPLTSYHIAGALTTFTDRYLSECRRMAGPSFFAACFSTSYSDSRLWSHYADGHRGVCLIFDVRSGVMFELLSFRRLFGEISDLEREQVLEQYGLSDEDEILEHVPIGNNEIIFHRTVDYSVEPFQIEFFRNISVFGNDELIRLWYTNDEGDTSELISEIGPDDIDVFQFLDIAGTKGSEWEYEQEYRMMLYDQYGLHMSSSERTKEYDFTGLKGLIFGVDTSEEDKVRIVKLIKDKCRSHDRSDFDFFQAEYSRHAGGVEARKILNL